MIHKDNRQKSRTIKKYTIAYKFVVYSSTNNFFSGGLEALKLDPKKWLNSSLLFIIFSFMSYKLLDNYLFLNVPIK